jgi:hypothetical protein
MNNNKILLSVLLRCSSIIGATLAGGLAFFYYD